MRPALIFLALLPLAACAPPGYQYDGFTLVSDAQEQARIQHVIAAGQAKDDARMDAYNAAMQKQWETDPAFEYQRTHAPPPPLSQDQLARAQNQMYVDKLYWSIGQVPPELYPSP
jgi:hypothetical protein